MILPSDTARANGQSVATPTLQQANTYTAKQGEAEVYDDMSNSIQAAKQQLRLSMRNTLKNLDHPTLQAQSDAVTNKILQHPLYRRAKRLSVYISMPTSELRTDAIIQDALSQNKKVFIPYIPPNKNSKMEMLRLKNIGDFKTNLIPNKWKIREFSHSSEPHTIFNERENGLNEDTKEGLDLILMPGLAFDRELNRLGHGRGYYDTYLHRCALFSHEKGLERPSTIALALNEQILKQEDGIIPALTVEDGHSSGHRDIKPDFIVYPDGELILDNTITV